MCANPELVFDVAKEGYTAWFFPLIGLGFLTLSLLLLWNERREPQNKRHWRTIFMVVFSALWTIVALFGTLGSHLRARSARASGNYQTVEGVVENFVPQPYNGHAIERFTVSGVPFSYSDYIVAPGFHQSRSHGGPITGGLYLRIGHVKGMILRLEVCR